VNKRRTVPHDQRKNKIKNKRVKHKQIGSVNLYGLVGARYKYQDELEALSAFKEHKLQKIM
jgi:hypothetical protein